MKLAINKVTSKHLSVPILTNKPERMISMKPCPFCGGKELRIERMEMWKSFTIYCLNCHMLALKKTDSEDEAKTFWNMRADD